ncbi:MAG TPA: hypothetical protein VG621_03065 [Candidatus Paceibacterota bacterium]|nr:hypothetical protein [Candidatus Paceibacterota bacterium]
MKAIKLDNQNFLVNTFGDDGILRDAILLIHRKRTIETKYHKDVPECGALEFPVWDAAAKKHKVVDLESDQDLKDLYNKVFTDAMDEFELS